MSNFAGSPEQALTELFKIMDLGAGPILSSEKRQAAVAYVGDLMGVADVVAVTPVNAEHTSSDNFSDVMDAYDPDRSASALSEHIEITKGNIVTKE